MKTLNIFDKLGLVHMQVLDYSKNWFRNFLFFLDFEKTLEKGFLAPKRENNLLSIAWNKQDRIALSFL